MTTQHNFISAWFVTSLLLISLPYLQYKPPHTHVHPRSDAHTLMWVHTYCVFTDNIVQAALITSGVIHLSFYAIINKTEFKKSTRTYCEIASWANPEWGDSSNYLDTYLEFIKAGINLSMTDLTKEKWVLSNITAWKYS